MSNIEKSTLYVVATPIGNLGDITLRAIDVLREADIILAEDTRVTSKLLLSLNIRKDQKLLSCHDFNEESRIQQVKELLDEGKVVALVSDAGTPLISDPGYKIVTNLRKENYKIVPIPGVSAAITALSVAGLPSDSFVFKGFLSAKKAKRQEQILEFKSLNTTVILYESVHRIEYLLADLDSVLPNVDIVVAKELTKQFETFVNGKPGQVIEFFKSYPEKLKGEFVVIVDCSGHDASDPSSSIDQELLLRALLEELPLKKAVKLTTELLNLKKNDVYQRALDLKKDMDLKKNA
ncbi:MULTISPECIES: 16S rRNA (cytidine(1402)-2'-O)-methyltransferase [unclassified Francisella]|uniref:16S rRNA (cytidine(1402)-2'-O)-methyltransferase n=1 Tax=unclassified Francisella TaxID=2610885 RepID=UPI002E30FE14|nr:MULTISPECIES: 16S rRNA (cytidine(1402)-2'-O)-methyltransferase [unclassified Francisella]MED7819166.1 16S rRNA (cytidine(1402)-2'-O)-methyltransferase [Francisella sp. 19S2-4]MED7830361.1 16S rRNA (cytidine(1402)-2'-O)-methyltransferase [Francisella sp. 19S2-10]